MTAKEGRERLATALLKGVEQSVTYPGVLVEGARAAVADLEKDAPIDTLAQRLTTLEAQVRSLQSQLSVAKLASQRGF